MTGTEAPRAACPACGGTELHEIYRLPAIPVQSCILLETADEAAAFPRAPLCLLFCDTCGFVFNVLFDVARVDYASTTEESQHFSGTFNAFARDLAAEIVSRHDLRDRFTLEIGCGKGDFLQELVRQSGTAALGVDPGFLPERLPLGPDDEIRFLKEYFDPAHIDRTPDLIVCRHTLEHIDDVGAFIADIARLIVPGHDTALFFETPDARRVLAEGAFWDIYYEHCSYFSMGSHARLFRRAGFEITDLRLAYDAQYILQYARPAQGGPILDAERDLEEMRALADAFPARIAAVRERWAEFVTTRAAAGKRVALWGGGSKAVSFLTTNAIQDDIAQVVDINPFKQGRYLPGTRLQVSAPDALEAAPPDTVIVMNPVYLGEIGQQLQDMGLAPELVAV